MTAPEPTLDPFGFDLHDPLVSDLEADRFVRGEAHAAMLEALAERAREERERQGGGFEDKTGYDGIPW